MPENVSVTEQEQICYICGRTSSDFDHIHQLVIQQFENQIKEKRSELRTNEKEYLRKYKEIVENTKGNPNMSLTVHTIRTDINTFKKIISHVEELLEFYDKYERKLSLGISNRTNLSDVLSAMGTKDTPELIRLKNYLFFLEAKLENYKQMKNSLISFELYKITTRLSHIIPDFVDPERTRSGRPVSPLDLALRSNSEMRNSKEVISIDELLDTAKQAINNDPKTPEDKKDYAYQLYKSFFFGYNNIEYNYYLCPICVTILKHGPKTDKFRLWRFDKERGRWDSVNIEFP